MSQNTTAGLQDSGTTDAPTTDYHLLGVGADGTHHVLRSDGVAFAINDGERLSRLRVDGDERTLADYYQLVERRTGWQLAKKRRHISGWLDA